MVNVYRGFNVISYNTRTINRQCTCKCELFKNYLLYLIIWTTFLTTKLNKKTSLANLSWPTRPEPIGGHIFTRSVCFSAYFVFRAPTFSAAASFCFWEGRTDVRTDTMRENNDYLFGGGLVGQKDGVVSFSIIYFLNASFSIKDTTKLRVTIITSQC